MARPSRARPVSTTARPRSHRPRTASSARLPAAIPHRRCPCGGSNSSFLLPALLSCRSLRKRNSRPRSLFISERRHLVALAAKNRLPAVYPLREFVDAGGLMAYGPNLPDLSRRAATYVDKILKGAKPADLPIEQPTTFELVINLKTA